MIAFHLILFFIVLIMTVLLTKRLLPILQRRHMGQRILEIGPRWHKSKEGTPTMGGLGFIFAIVLSGIGAACLLFFQGEDVRMLLLVLGFALANGAVGAVDDLAKLRKKQNEGLLPWQKLLLQSVFVAAFLALQQLYGGTTEITLPFAWITVDLKIYYYIFSMLYILGTVNFVNLTDGIDGLAASVTLICSCFFWIISQYTGNLPLSVCTIGLMGSCIGFLFFNAHPARIFMGDTGSLFLGALLIGCAYLSPSPLLLLPTGIVYYLEGASVILQVLIFKLARKRLFRMAPLHHHFEKCGWNEWKVVVFFTFITIAGDAIALLSVSSL